MPHILSADEIHSISLTLSTARFSTYLEAKQECSQAAFNLYQWNLQVSSAMLAPLHVFEVTLRNALSEALEEIHGERWPWSEGFLRSLPNPPRGYSQEKDLRQTARNHDTTGKVIADLKFAFWDKILAKRFGAPIWKNKLRTVFPNAPRELSGDNLRKEIQLYTNDIRKLRNRIAHHEPIFQRQLDRDLRNMLTIISWRNYETMQWLEGIQQVSGILAERP